MQVTATEPTQFKKIEMSGHKGGVYVVKFSKDGEHVMSGSQDKTVKLWNPYKGLLVKSYEVNSHDVLDLAITQDNCKFSSVGFDKQVYLVDSIKGNVLRRFYGHTERINTIAFNPNESVLVSGSYDCSVRIWDLKSQGSEPIQVLSDAKDSITKILVLEDKIMTASVDGAHRVYDLRMGQLQTDYFNFTINGLDISPDHKYPILSGLDNSIRLFDLSSGEVVKSFQNLHQSKNYTMTIKYSLNLDSILTTSETGDIVSYDLSEKNNKIFKSHTKVSSGLDIHPNKSNLFVSSGFDGKVILWDTLN